MRTIANCLIVFIVLLCQKTEAATAPLSSSFVLTSFDIGAKNSDVVIPSIHVTHKKVGFIKKLQYKTLQKGLKYLSNRSKEETKPKTNGLSIVSLVLGLIAVIGLFTGIGLAALIPALAALITGLVTLRKKNNNNKGSRAMSIIGLILGGGLILLFIIFILSYGGQ